MLSGNKLSSPRDTVLNCDKVLTNVIAEREECSEAYLHSASKHQVNCIHLHHRILCMVYYKNAQGLDMLRLLTKVEFFQTSPKYNMKNSSFLAVCTARTCCRSTVAGRFYLHAKSDLIVCIPLHLYKITTHL